MAPFTISGVQGLILFLYVAAIFGALHLLCAAHPDNQFAKSWIGLGF